MIIKDYQTTRSLSVNACKPLKKEDYGLQCSIFTSPPKWHLAHTTWFFETFILKHFVFDYKVYHPSYEVLFNSYYNGVGLQFPRSQRGLLSRPTVSEVMEYREYVDVAMISLLAQTDHYELESIEQRCRLGIEHEKQHQELFYTNLKYSFSLNPLNPAYYDEGTARDLNQGKMLWLDYTGGLVDTGVEEKSSHFAFDNETPAHKVFIEPFSLSNRLVTNGEFQDFINDGGYQMPQFWLSDGWTALKKNNWTQPLYWREEKGKAMEFTLYGLQERKLDNPVCHVSGYEADAYANWENARLPTEKEWEFSAKQHQDTNNNLLSLHTRGVENLKHENDKLGLKQLYDSCWQWTASAYRPYPGFQTAEGAIGEYNGKFMCNQWVLRGGSCISSANHLRPSYRNFFYPDDRWQFSGIRLATKL